MRFASFAALAALLASSAPALAQDAYTLTGRVVDARLGDGIPGASVLLQETPFGAATDVDGRFSLVADVPAGTYTLRASFVGYTTVEVDVTLAGDRTVDVGTLELADDALRTTEVVVTGSGVPTERRQLGNTIASIEAADLQDANSISVDQALAGKVAGAVVTQNSGDPAGGISIRLRGTGTILGSGDPLYIVDGVIVDNSSAQLIDLGGTAQNRLVDINPADIERIEIVKGAAAAALYGSRANNGVVQIFTKRGRTGAPRVTLQTGFNTNGIRETLAINDVPFAAPVNPGDPNAPRESVGRFDYQDDIFRQALGSEQYLSISGGAGGTSYFLSGGHLANEGIVNGTLFRRINARARLSQQLSSALNVSAGGAFTNSFSDDVPNGGLVASYGALTGFIFGPNTTDIAPDPETGVYPDIGARSNPRDVIDNFDFSQLTNRFTGNVQADYAPIDGLSINALAGIDTYNQRGLAFIPLGTTSATEATGRSRRSDRNVTLVNTGLTAQYTTQLTDGLESTTVAGVDIQNERATTFAVDATDLTLGLETTVAGNTVVTGESRAEINIFGAFAQETLGIQDQLFLTGAVRVDASSVFGEDNRWNVYPKVSASYDVPGLSGTLSTVRLRTSLGQTGGLTAIGPFDRFNALNLVPYVGGGGFVP
ncbi:MAG: carboxypeptidase-like regulatory domain-containing protein, partial [Bacteroidota bacterium]